MEALADADLVLVVVDKNQALSEEDANCFVSKRRPAIVVENKSDLQAQARKTCAGPGNSAVQSRQRQAGILRQSGSIFPRRR